MNKTTYEHGKVMNRAEAAKRSHIAGLKREAKMGNMKAEKQLNEILGQRTINRNDKRTFGIRGSAGHGRKKRRAMRAYEGGQIFAR